MTRILHSKVAADATAVAQLGADYGLTLPIRIVFDVAARLSGNDWVPVVNSMTGEYCVQARLMGHQTDITDASIPGTVSAANFQAVLDALTQLGVPAASHNFYSLAAVQAHENAHANRCRLALENKREAIVASIESLSVPVDPGAGPPRTALQGLAALQALPAYQAVVGAAYSGSAWTLWFNELLVLVAHDHAGHEWCHVAERRVTRDLIAQIEQRVEQNRWRAVPAQLALPAHLGVAQAHNQLNAVAPVVAPQAVQMPQGALGVAAARAQVQQPQPQGQGQGQGQAQGQAQPRPVDLPDGALGIAGARARLQAQQAPANAGPRPNLEHVPKRNLPVWPPLPQ